MKAFIVMLFGALAGCTPQLQYHSSGAIPVSAPAAPIGLRRALVFSDDGKAVFLGCLTCSDFDPDSILNPYSEFGSPYGANSIRNKYSDYGSPYSDTSACNKYASKPPKIVWDDGEFAGVLSVNKFAVLTTTAYQKALALCAN